MTCGTRAKRSVMSHRSVYSSCHCENDARMCCHVEMVYCLRNELQSLLPYAFHLHSSPLPAPIVNSDFRMHTLENACTYNAYMREESTRSHALALVSKRLRSHIALSGYHNLRCMVCCAATSGERSDRPPTNYLPIHQPISFQNHHPTTQPPRNPPRVPPNPSHRAT